MELTLSQQIFLLILGAGVTGAFGMFCLMKAMGYARWAAGHSLSWRKEVYERQDRRVKWIRKWASDTMATVPMNLRSENRQVLVTYKDLLSVWDLSDKIWFDLTED
jgi:hypothetical protein